METVVSIKPLLAILVSALAIPLILLSHRNPNLREFWSLAAGVLKFLIVVSMASVILAGKTIEYTLWTIAPGIDFAFRVDALSLLFATTASLLWIVTSVYSIGYMRSLKEHAQTRYFASFATALSATMGVAFSANLFLLYIFYEILTLSTYFLVTHKETPEAWTGGKKYMVYLFGASKAFLLGAIILTYTTTGTLEFSKAGIFSGAADPRLLTFIYILFIAGFAKAAIMPLHSWLPAAMVAPTPVSALLHAVAVVKVGVFSILRIILDVFGLHIMKSLNLGIATAFFVSFTIIMASIVALAQDNLKLRLAYSTVSQLSYVILGVALLAPSSLVGGIIHIANHAFSKITLFFCAGSIYVASHKTEISELSGIGRKMPWTMAAFAIGTLSMIGVPPAAGFVSKWYLALGSIEAREIPILLVLLTSTLLNAAYFVPIVYKAFFEPPKVEMHLAGNPGPPSDHGEEGHNTEIKEGPYLVVIPLVLTAIASIVVGLYPNYFLSLIKEVLVR